MMKAKWKPDTFFGVSMSQAITGNSLVDQTWEVVEVIPTGDWRNNLYLLKDFAGEGKDQTVAERFLEIVND